MKPSQSVVRGVVIGGILLLLTTTLAARLGLVAVVLPDVRPEGTFAWDLSRALGVTAYLALTLELLLGLGLSTQAGDRLLSRARTVELQHGLSVAALGLTGAHALALFGDRFIGFDALDLLVPFVAPYRPLAVGVGVLAAWFAVVVHASFGARKRLGPKVWRALHALSFLAYAFATGHGLTAGTDSKSAWLRTVCAASVASVTALLAVRVIGAVGSRRGRA